MRGRTYRQRSWFTRFAKTTARSAGHPATFCVAVAIIVLWAVTGPLFGFSDTWQLIINTGTTIITFLMVFLIQNAQTRDAVAIQLKLDEIIRAVEGADDDVMDLEDLDDATLEARRVKYAELAARARDLALARDRSSQVPAEPRR